MAKARIVPQAPQLSRLHEAMVYAAYLVETYGDAYLPVFESLADDWDAAQRENDTGLARARRVLAAHTLDGGVKAIR